MTADVQGIEKMDILAQEERMNSSFLYLLVLFSPCIDQMMPTLIGEGHLL